MATENKRHLVTALSPAVLKSALERFDILQRRERGLTGTIGDRVEQWTQDYLSTVGHTFHRHFINKWDFAKTKTAGIDRELLQDGNDALDTLGEDVKDDLDQEVGDGYKDGWLAMMWDGYRHGYVSDEEVADTPAPDEDATDAWVLAAAMGGLALGDRVGRWIGNTKIRLKTGLNAAMGREMSLAGTGLVIETLADQLAGQLDLLGTSELQRAFTGGMETVKGLFDGRLAGVESVWLTRQDGAVCPICAALHGVVTVLEPVSDSHPGCRCVKVPLFRVDNAGDGGVQGISFDDFTQRF